MVKNEFMDKQGDPYFNRYDNRPKYHMPSTTSHHQPHLIGGRIPLSEVKKAEEKERKKQEAQENDEKYDDYYNKIDETEDKMGSAEMLKMKQKMAGMTEAQKKRFLRTAYKRGTDKYNQDMARIEEERRRAEEEARRANEGGFWDVATNLLINAGSKAIGSVIPGSEKIVNTGLNLINNAVKGGKLKRKSTKRK